MNHLARAAVGALPVVLAVGLLAGCAPDPSQDLPQGGVDATTGRIVIDDIWIDGPQGIPAGSTAQVRLALFNESAAANDALVGVSSPDAAHAVLEHDGHPVPEIAVPAGGHADLEWAGGVELQDVRHRLEPGQRIPVTLTFARSAPVTVMIAAGPLGVRNPAPTSATA